ncbi:hypothetical protein Lal_00032732 [Lupinus albus]|nr:hypothetical protein Lal_00032732 [Lupinus albus]
MGESMMEQCRMEVEGIRFAVKSKGTTLERVGAERISGRARWDRTSTTKALCWANTNAERRKLEEQMRLDTPIVLAINE